MNILITICARGGSKGIPGKNIKELNGLPLIAYTILTAKKIQKALPGTDIELSTDDEVIRKVAKEQGLDSAYVRPGFLANDTAGKLDAINDIRLYAEDRNGMQYDFVIDMDVTSPLRTAQDVLDALSQLKENEEAVNIFSVSPANRNPYFNMVEKKENGFYNVVKSNAAFKTRQSAPVVYDMNASFYIFKKKYFEQGLRISTTDFSLVHVMDHVCFDLDHKIDFLIMELLLKEKALDFEL